MPKQPIPEEEPMNVGIDQWPERLKASAALLHQTSIQLQAAVNDQHRFALLTAPTHTDSEAMEEVRNFKRLLVTALTALIDLTAYDNPEQEYPELEPWFEFTCSNVCYGRRIVIIPDRPPHE
jgi:hypothetical protein